MIRWIVAFFVGGAVLILLPARAAAQIVRVDFAGVMDFSDIGGSASEPYAGVFVYDATVPPFESGVINGMAYAHYQLNPVSFQIFGTSPPPSHVSILVQDAIVPGTCNDFFTLTLLFASNGLAIRGTTRRLTAMGVNATACPATMFSSAAFPTNVDIAQASTAMNDYAQLESGRVLVGDVPPTISNVVFSTQAPGAPTNFQVSVTGNLVNMSWSPPSVGQPPTSYSIVVRTPGGQLLTEVPAGNVTSMSAPAPNGTYRLSVRASNASGAGPESNAVTVTVPQAVVAPGAPTNLTATVNGTTALFSWTPAVAGGAVANYLLVAGTTPGFVVPVASLMLPGVSGATIPDVPPGTYYARVLALNAGGTSGPSNEVVVTVAAPSLPGAPTLNAAVVSGTTVSLSWTPGAGSPPASYVLTASLTPAGNPLATVPMTGTSMTFVDVPSGTYFLRLAAVGSVGTGPASNEITVVVP